MSVSKPSDIHDREVVKKGKDDKKFVLKPELTERPLKNHPALLNLKKNLTSKEETS